MVTRVDDVLVYAHGHAAMEQFIVDRNKRLATDFPLPRCALLSCILISFPAIFEACLADERKGSELQ